jgi:hypothetical protein
MTEELLGHPKGLRLHREGQSTRASRVGREVRRQRLINAAKDATVVDMT